MTLPQIDQRLGLLKDYIAYISDNWKSSSYGHAHILRTEGIWINYGRLSFNQWLFNHGHSDLMMDNRNEFVSNDKLFTSYQFNGMTFNMMHIDFNNFN